MTRPSKVPSQAGFELRTFRLWGGSLNHLANEHKKALLTFSREHACAIECFVSWLVGCSTSKQHATRVSATDQLRPCYMLPHQDRRLKLTFSPTHNTLGQKVLVLKAQRKASGGAAAKVQIFRSVVRFGRGSNHSVPHSRWTP